MSTPIVIDCDPGHDDAIAILLALASPEVELRGVVTVAGNQTIDKTTRNALKVLELAGRADVPVVRGAEAPLERTLRTAAHVHGESGLEGPDLPEPSAGPSDEDPAAWLEPGVVLVATGPLTNVAQWVERGVTIERIVWMGGAIAAKTIKATRAARRAARGSGLRRRRSPRARCPHCRSRATGRRRCGRRSAPTRSRSRRS